jgi:hypothetical protein
MTTIANRKVNAPALDAVGALGNLARCWIDA